jgi:DNA-binding MarR family transcriptional regulator
VKDAVPIELPIRIEDREHEALVSVWWTGMLMRRLFRRMFRTQIGSEGQFNVLRAIWSADRPLTQKDLGEMLLVDKGNVTGLVTTLVSAGLVRRDPAPKDRRSHHVVLTAKGRVLVEEVAGIYDEKVELAMTALTGREQDTLIRLTLKLRKGLTLLEPEGE